MEDYCNKCGMCCKLIPVNLQEKLILRDGIQTIDEDFYTSLVKISIEEAYSINEAFVKNVQKIFPDAAFCYCEYLSEDNLCTNSQKPNICQNFPSYPLAFIDEDCGYCGEIFIKSEEVKQKVRKYKEEILYYESVIKSGCKEEKVYKKIIDSLERFIVKYNKYGAQDW